MCKQSYLDLHLRHQIALPLQATIQLPLISFYQVYCGIKILIFKLCSNFNSVLLILIATENSVINISRRYDVLKGIKYFSVLLTLKFVLQTRIASQFIHRSFSVIKKSPGRNQSLIQVSMSILHKTKLHTTKRVHKLFTNSSFVCIIPIVFSFLIYSLEYIIPK